MTIYANTAMTIIPIRMRVRVEFIPAKIRNKCENVAMSRQPITAPNDIARKALSGFMPIKRPTIEPTSPPEP